MVRDLLYLRKPVLCAGKWSDSRLGLGLGKLPNSGKGRFDYVGVWSYNSFSLASGRET
ncbi:hypothetical protein LMZ02_07860 [Paenibacillus macerans]|uniref:hypothetical protein n=1 Tax=Paenibacillus macerans TaxID=44252 RepID=UPI0012D90A1B|nr:hypothetical protein [Paenibacillus macerans]MBS5914229.1 hypothetical protein [Paenibacillus macerans]UMV49255.1 hypothetical protein LMZ02_07860 [Paenibacillus macerans]